MASLKNVPARPIQSAAAAAWGVLIAPRHAQCAQVVGVAFMLMPGGGGVDREAVAHQQAGPVRRDEFVEGRAVAVRDDAVERHPVLARGGEHPEAAGAAAPPARLVGVEHGGGEHLRVQRGVLIPIPHCDQSIAFQQRQSFWHHLNGELA